VKPFDHSKTRFALVAHTQVAGAKCHAGERTAALATTCVSCHGLQDKHAGRDDGTCEICHAPSKCRTASFDHNSARRFPLRRGRGKLACERCHTGDTRRNKLASHCAACHRQHDPHTCQLGAACEQCHKETDWRQAVAFDHDLRRFARRGLHAAVPCEWRRRGASFNRAGANGHEDLHHAGRLGVNGASCHNPMGWSRWRFDHDRQSPDPLTGAHRALPCHACHKTSATANLGAPTACQACHSQGNTPDDAFGRAWEKYHTTVSFRQGLGKP
jgi:hypothetical protein